MPKKTTVPLLLLLLIPCTSLQATSPQQKPNIEEKQKQAIQLLQKDIAKHKQQADGKSPSPILAQKLCELAHIHEQRKEWTEANQTYKQAHQYVETKQVTKENQPVLILLHTGLGNTNLALKNYHQASKHYQNNLDIAFQHKNTPAIADAHYYLAKTALSMPDIDKRKIATHIDQAIINYQKIATSNPSIATYTKLAETYLLKQQYDRAFKHEDELNMNHQAIIENFEKARKSIQQSKHKRKESPYTLQVYHQLSQLYLQEHNYPKTIAICLEYLQGNYEYRIQHLINQQANPSTTLIEMYTTLAQAYRATTAYDKVLTTYTSALKDPKLDRASNELLCLIHANLFLAYTAKKKYGFRTSEIETKQAKESYTKALKHYSKTSSLLEEQLIPTKKNAVTTKDPDTQQIQTLGQNYLILSQLYLANSNYKKAIETAQKPERIHLKHFYVFANRLPAEFYFILGTADLQQYKAHKPTQKLKKNIIVTYEHVIQTHTNSKNSLNHLLDTMDLAHIHYTLGRLQITDILEKATILYQEDLKKVNPVIEHYEKARAHYNQADQYHQIDIPEDTMLEIHFGLEWAYLLQGNYPKVVEHNEAFLAIDKDRKNNQTQNADLARIHYALGKAYFELGDSKKALEHYKKAAKQLKKAKNSQLEQRLIFSDIQKGIGTSYICQQQYDKAITHYQDTLKNLPKKSAKNNPYHTPSAFYRADAHLGLATAYSRKNHEENQEPISKHLEKAIATYQTLLSQNKDTPLALAKHTPTPLAPCIHYYLGKAYLMQADYKKAIQHYEKCNLTQLTHNKRIAVYKNLLLAYEKQKNYKALINSYLKIINDPNLKLAASEAFQLHRGLARAYGLNKEYNKARKTYEKALTIYNEDDGKSIHINHSTWVEFHAEAGKAYLLLGKYPHAIHAYESSLKHAQKTKVADTFKAEVLFGLGKAHLISQQHKKAHTYLTQSLPLLAPLLKNKKTLKPSYITCIIDAYTSLGKASKPHQQNKALQSYQAVLELIHRELNKKERENPHCLHLFAAECYRGLAKIATSQKEITDYTQKAITTYKKLQNSQRASSLFVAQVYYGLIDSHILSAKPTQAKQLFTKYRNLINSSKNKLTYVPLIYAKMCYTIGRYHARNVEAHTKVVTYYETTIEYYQRAMKENKALVKAVTMWQDIYSVMRSIFFMRGEYTLTIRYGLQHLTLAKKQSANPLTLGSIYLQLAIAYKETDQVKEAKNMFVKSIEYTQKYLKEGNNKLRVMLEEKALSYPALQKILKHSPLDAQEYVNYITAQTNLGIAHWHTQGKQALQHYNKAEKALNLANEFLKKPNSTGLAAIELYKHRGNIHLVQKKYQEAYRYYKQLITFFKEPELADRYHLFQKATIYETFAEACLGIQKYDEAIDGVNKAIVLRTQDLAKYDKEIVLRKNYHIAVNLSYKQQHVHQKYLDQSKSYDLLGMVYQKQARYHEAQDNKQKAGDAYKKSIEAFSQSLKIKEKHNQKNLDGTDNLYEENTDEAPIYLRLGSSHHALGLMDKEHDKYLSDSVNFYTKAISLSKSSSAETDEVASTAKTELEKVKKHLEKKDEPKGIWSNISLTASSIHSYISWYTSSDSASS